MIRERLRLPYHLALVGLMASLAATGCSQTANPVAPSPSAAQPQPSASSSDRVSATGGPKGDARGTDVGRMLFKFNVIATPKSNWVVPDGECTNNGHRIFFQRGSGNTLGTIHWDLIPNLNPPYQIEDCDGTADAEANVDVSESQAFYVVVRLLGPKTSTLSIRCKDVVEAGADDLCVLDDVTVAINRNVTTKIMSNVVDNEVEEVLWTLSGDWRIFEVRIYEKL